MVVVGVVAALALGAYCLLIAVTSRRIPIALRLLPLGGWLLLVSAALGAPELLAALGGAMLVVGLAVDVFYERVLGGGGRSRGRHGMDRPLD